MENFVKTSFESVNGSVIMGIKPFSHGLVILNDKGVAWNIVAKVRNTDKRSVIKALAKAILAETKTRMIKNSTEAAQKSKKTVAAKVSPALSGYVVAVADKNGDILQNSMLSVRNDAIKDKGTLRDVIRFTTSQPVYKLVVEQGLDWSDERVVEALKWWVEAAIEQMDYVKNLDAALGAAADSTEKEEKAAEAAAKKTAKDTKPVAKEKAAA